MRSSVHPKSLIALLVFVGCVGGAGSATAQSASAPRSQAPQPLQWSDDWRGMRAWEYPVSLGLMAGAFSARFLLRPPPPNWVGVSDFEQSIVDRLAVRDNPAHSNIRQLSDLGFYGAMAYRLVDSALLPGLLHPDSWRVAWKMSWIDLEALAVVAAVEWGTQIFVGRVRPTALNCADPTRRGHLCDRQNPDYARSFIAGHTATATAVAGLTCLHHGRLPLYGGGAADTLACAALVMNALGNGVARVVSERHYPSDVLMGWGLGIAAGWVLPRALHYGWGEQKPVETVGLPEVRERPALIFSVSPAIFDARPGLAVVGQF